MSGTYQNLLIIGHVGLPDCWGDIVPDWDDGLAWVGSLTHYAKEEMNMTDKEAADAAQIRQCRRMIEAGANPQDMRDIGFEQEHIDAAIAEMGAES